MIQILAKRWGRDHLNTLLQYEQWWCVAIEENRHDYDRIKCGLSCDPQKKANIGDDGNVLDHPLAQDEGVS